MVFIKLRTKQRQDSLPEQHRQIIRQIVSAVNFQHTKQIPVWFSLIHTKLQTRVVDVFFFL